MSMELGPQHHIVNHLPPLELDALANNPLDAMGDFSNPPSATAPSMVPDLSQVHTLPGLTHFQDTRAGHSQDYPDSTDIDFHGGHITLHLEPAISFGGYEHYDTQASALNPIHGLHPSQTNSQYGELGLSGAMVNCFSNKPWGS